MGLIKPTFFCPDDEFAKWIIERAGDRMIFDVGFGNGRFLEHLWDLGFNKLLGTDPYTDVQEIREYWIKEKRAGGRSTPHLFWDEIGEGISKSIIDKSKGKLLGVLNRPCHSPQFVRRAYEVFRDSDNELLYIGLKENVMMDLKLNDIPFEHIKHKGKSRDNEIVLKLT